MGGGGFSMEAMLRAAWEAGVVMTGLSAGSLCWFEEGVTAFHGASRPVRGVGFLPYSNAVHYDDKPARRAAFLAAVADGMTCGYGTGDGAALHFVGTELADVVDSRPKARAYYVAPGGAEVTETELATRFLGTPLAVEPALAILAMGGGGFTAGSDDPALDELVLQLTGAARPRISLLPTAGGDSEHQIRRFHETYGDRPCEPSHVSLFRLGRQPVPLRAHLLSQDAIYVGGESMVNLLAIWQVQGLAVILREAWQAGVVLAGLSAGSVCWLEWGVSTGSGHARPRSRPPRGLELRPPRQRAVAALIFRDRTLDEVVSARAAAGAYEVDRAGERALPSRAISAARPIESAAPAVAELRRLRLARLVD